MADEVTITVESIGILVYLDCLVSDKAKKEKVEIMLLTLDVNQDRLVHVIADCCTTLICCYTVD